MYVLVLDLAFHQPEIDCHSEFVKLMFQWIDRRIGMCLYIIFNKLFLCSSNILCGFIVPESPQREWSIDNTDICFLDIGLELA